MTGISTTPRLIAEKDGAIARLVFNQPEKRNAVSLDMWEAIPAIINAFADDPEIRVLVIGGAGGKAFVSGADISEFEKVRATPGQVRHYEEVGELATRAIASFAKPSIAHIRGDCIGGGLAVAMRCDIRIAAGQSRFGVPAAKLGVAYGASDVKLLSDIVGPAFAREVLLTARLFGAQEAQAMGLVNRVLPNEALDDFVQDYCQRIAEGAPLTHIASKLAVAEATGTGPGAQALKAAMKRCFDSEDYNEGRAAFMEKRKPRFRGC